MNIQREMEKLEETVTHLVSDLLELGEISDEEAKSIIDIMQSIEDKFSTVLAKFSVEVGDERID